MKVRAAERVKELRGRKITPENKLLTIKIISPVEGSRSGLDGSEGDAAVEGVHGGGVPHAGVDVHVPVKVSRVSLGIKE